MALVGSGLLAVAGMTGTGAASSHNAVVYNDSDGSFVAENVDTDSVVYDGWDFIDAIQAAVDSLTSGRDWKEKVRVDATGDTGSHSSTHAVDLSSYTILDVPGNINVDDDNWNVVPARADSVSNVEIQRMNVSGAPAYGIRISHCDNVIIDDVNMDLTSGLGIRIDGRDGPNTTNVTLNNAYITGSGTHAVETYGVDYIDIGTVETYDTGGCGLLLNDSSNVTVDYVNATRADQGGGYAGFRCANNAGGNITVNRVDAVDCGRGIFTVSGSYGIDIYDVYVSGAGDGALIQDTQDVLIKGGTFENNSYNGIRIDSRSSDTHHTSRYVTLENLVIQDNGSWGVRETGPDTSDNEIIDNDFCNNGSGAVTTYSDTTDVHGNSYNCNDSGSSGSISTGTYSITNVNSGKALDVADSSTDDGANVQQYEYWGGENQQWYVEETSDGTYRLENVNSGKVMDVSEMSTDDGANVLQWADSGGDNQRWHFDSL